MIAYCGRARRVGRAARSALAVALVALTGLGGRLRFLPAVGGERAADVVALLELALPVAADEALVRAGVDQLAPAGARLRTRRGFGRFRRRIRCLLCGSHRGASFDWRCRTT